MEIVEQLTADEDETVRPAAEELRNLLSEGL
jgi:hypothetical protein